MSNGASQPTSDFWESAGLLFSVPGMATSEILTWIGAHWREGKARARLSLQSPDIADEIFACHRLIQIKRVEHDSCFA
jgi:hypothetical protein